MWCSAAGVLEEELRYPVTTGFTDHPRGYYGALSDFYDDDVLAALAAGPEEFSRWGIPQGEGELLGALQGEQPVASAVDEVASGEDPQEVADQAAEDVRSIRESLS